MNIKDAFTFNVKDDIWQVWECPAVVHTYAGSVVAEFREGATHEEAQRGRIIATTDDGSLSFSDATELNSGTLAWSLSSSVSNNLTPGQYWIAARCLQNTRLTTIFSFSVTIRGKVVS